MKDWAQWEGRPCSVSTVRQVFGSWGEALSAAGMHPAPARPKEDESLRELALENAHKLAAELGRPPTCQEWVAAKVRPCLRTIMKYFGSWKGFLRSAGFNRFEEAVGRGGFEKSKLEEILEGIHVLAELLGKPPTARDWRQWKERPYSLATVCRVFGSWGEALAAAGHGSGVSCRGNRGSLRLMALPEYRG